MSNTVAERLAKKSRKKIPTKQVRLKLVYVDFWSSVKFSFLLSLCVSICISVATILVYTVLLSTGVLTRVDSLFMDIVGSETSLLDTLNFTNVVTFTVVVGVLNLIIGTAMGTVASMIYNLLARALGGFQLGFTST